MKMSTSHEGVSVLVTGGCGYIGTHTIVCLLDQGYNVVVVDNLSNASSVSLDRVAELAKLDEEARKKRVVFHEVDVCDKEALRKVFETSPTFQACIHFAGLKVSFAFRSDHVRSVSIGEGERSWNDSLKPNSHTNMQLCHIIRLSEKAQRSL